MHHLRSLRRLALGAAVAGAAIGAVPAMASAAGTTTCSYGAGFGGVVSVNADPRVNDLTIAVVGQILAISTDATPQTACFGSGTLALTTNTSRIVVNTKVDVGAVRGPIAYTVDQSQGVLGPGPSPESDGNSEIETTIITNAPSSSLTLIGTPQRDVIAVGGNTRGDVNFGADSDIDLSITSRTSPIRVSAGDGDDFISGDGNPGGIPGPSTALLNLAGGAGNDVIIGGAIRDTISGGPDNDSLRTSGGSIDAVNGGSGFDDAIVDAVDTPITGVESVSIVGRLRLTPHVLRTRADETSRLKMSWTHPKSWRQLRKLDLRLYKGAERVGNVTIRPHGERLAGGGAVKLLAGGSRVTHHGKTVTAKLAMRLPKSLAGVDLRVDVPAIDSRGHQQTERGAGTIRVVK